MDRVKNFKNEQIIAYISAAFFFLTSIFNIINEGFTLSVIIMIGLGITLILRNKIAFIVLAIANIIYIFVDTIAGVEDVLSVLSYALLVILMILSIKKNNIIKKIWYIPGVLFGMVYMLDLSQSYYLHISPETLFVELSSSIIEAGALLFASLWSKEKMGPDNFKFIKNYNKNVSKLDSNDSKKAFNIKEAFSKNFNPNISNNVNNANKDKVGKESKADQIVKYKDLLDSGVITKEEFDAKKNEILKS